MDTTVIEMQDISNPVLVCKTCHRKNPFDYYFCPNCGKELRPKPLSTSILTQFGIYLLSLFLPPLGLWPGIKYLKASSGKEKMVGIIATTITLAISILTLLYVFELIKDFQSVLDKQFQNESFRNSLNEQLKRQIEDQFNFTK